MNVPFTESGLEVEGQGNIQHERTREGGESHARVYDPLWTNALNFLDLIDEHGLLQRDPRKARIGQLVLASGALEVMDLALVKGLWAMPSVKDTVSTAMAHMSEEQRNQFSLAMEIVRHFPHLVQGTLTAGNVRVWSTLNADSLVAPPGDLLLKHGVTVGGVWNLVGILDAYPQDKPSPPPVPLFGNELILGSTLFAQLLTSLAPMVPAFLGRPIGSYGVTPLLRACLKPSRLKPALESHAGHEQRG